MHLHKKGPVWFAFVSQVYLASSVVYMCRTPVSGGVCHGSHRSCWNMSGDSSKRWSPVGSGEAQHPQTAWRGFLLWEDLQAQWVSELINLTVQSDLFVWWPWSQACAGVFQWYGVQRCWDHIRRKCTDKWTAANCTEVSFREERSRLKVTKGSTVM